MIFGIGIDILEISHFQKALQKGGANFLELVFNKNEIEYAQKKEGLSNLATTFAGKEAVFKALNLPPQKNFNYFRKIEISHLASGKPQIKLKAPLSRKFPSANFHFFISISYTPRLASAFVILEKIK